MNKAARKNIRERFRSYPKSPPHFSFISPGSRGQGEEIKVLSLSFRDFSDSPSVQTAAITWGQTAGITSPASGHDLETADRHHLETDSRYHLETAHWHYLGSQQA